MTSGESIKYPNIPVKHWWTLRSKFKKSIPTIVTPGYIATVLVMEEKSAKVNIIPSLVKCKIIDSEGKPLERAKSWRDDKDYSKVCEAIRKEIYPDELLEALPGPDPDQDSVKRWFANKLGVGIIAQGRLSAVYKLLQKADVANETITVTTNKPQKRVKKQKKVIEKPIINKIDEGDSKISQSQTPSIHVDIQIHISPESSKEQIDHIFENLAKYYKK